LAVELLFDKNIRRNAALFWFALQDVGIFQIFYSRAVIQRTIVDSPALFETGLAEKITVCAVQPVCRRSRRIRGIFV
jgi:hypothetical protein